MADGIEVDVLNKNPMPGSLGVSHRVFDQAVAQEFFDSYQSFDVHLRVACIHEDCERLKVLFDMFIEFRKKLLQAGAYLHDPLPGNLLLTREDNMLLSDVGAVSFFSREQLIRLSKTAFRDKIAGAILFAFQM